MASKSSSAALDATVREGISLQSCKEMERCWMAAREGLTQKSKNASRKDLEVAKARFPCRIKVAGVCRACWKEATLDHRISTPQNNKQRAKISILHTCIPSIRAIPPASPSSLPDTST